MYYFLGIKHWRKPVKWTLALIGRHAGVSLQETNHKGEADISLGFDNESDIQLSRSFYARLEEKHFSHSAHFSGELLIRNEAGQADYLSTIFYLVNSIQEYNALPADLDHYGRFKYTSSVQYKFDLIQCNYVIELIKAFISQIKEKGGHISFRSRRSRIFLSHDIDFLFSGIKTESLWALRRGEWRSIWSLIFGYVMGKHPYFNIDRIVDLDTEAGFKSCFYWIVHQGRSQDGIKNGDYSIEHADVQHNLAYVEGKGCENGLHKSTLSADMATESQKLKDPVSNRYHFLKFTLPEAYNEVEDTDIRVDTSLGFAEHFGFRNSYGLPFRPFDWKAQRTMSMVEMPLHIMDGTFLYYLKEDPGSVAGKVIDFIEKNKTDAVLSLLWHNNELSEYSFAGMATAYKEILIYLKEENYESVLPSDIYREFNS